MQPEDLESDETAPAGDGLTYAEAGVSIEAGAALVERIKPAAARTARAGVMGGLGGFGALFDLKAAGFEDPVLVAATDGVGTKLRIAIETGLARGVGVDLVAMCVNDLICQGAEPLFFLDYFATGALDAAQAAMVVEGVADGCLAAGCALVGGETAEMPGLYAPGDFDLAGFAVGAAERSALLPRPATPGDAVIGLWSDGLHSNGFSLARRVVEIAGLDWDAPAPFHPETPLGEALLTPTKIYVAPLLALLRDPALGPAVRGFAHITGGGLPENAPRCLTPDLGVAIDLTRWRPPAAFEWLAAVGGVSEAEMLRAFNCGVGMIVVAAAEAAPAMLEWLAADGAAGGVIGAVEETSDAPRARFFGAAP